MSNTIPISLKSFLITAFVLCSSFVFSQGTDCSTADPFCTSQLYNFPASTDNQSPVGPDYGCLFTQPNPAFYYLEVSQAGNIDIHIQSTANVDVDFICWGPFSSLSAACASGLTGNSVDCSYSPLPEEDCNIPNTQIGQIYVLLITNYSNQPTNIEFSQTGGTGATNCNIINQCSVLFNNPNISACNNANNTYTINGSVSFAYQPTVGYLIVADNNGRSDTLYPPFSSPFNYSIPFNPADGAVHNLTAYFTSESTCTATINYQAPAACNPNVCLISGVSTNVSSCDSITNNYVLSGTIFVSGAPNNGTLNIIDSNGNNQTLSAPFSSSIPFNITSNPNDGLVHSLSIQFSSAPGCSYTLNYQAPNVCRCNVIAQVRGNACIGDTIHLEAIQQNNGFSYIWSGPNGFNSLIQNPSIYPANATQNGNYTVVINSGFCTDTSSIAVNVLPSPIVNIVSTAFNPSLPHFHYCHTDSIRLVAQPSNYQTYTWNNGNTNDTTKYLGPGNYTVTVKDNNGCETIVQQTITNSSPEVNITGNQNYCMGDSILLTANVVPAVGIINYFWPSENSIAQSVYVKDGIHKVIITDASGCKDSASVSSAASPFPNANFNWSPKPSFKNEAVTFNDLSSITSGNNVEWIWNFISTANTSSLQNPSYTFSDTGYFDINLIVTSNVGCTDTIKKKIRIIDYVQEINVFTPNGDGKNDLVYFKYLDYFNNNTLVIFDRWGKKVFEKENYKNDWGGDDLNSGTYYYILNIPENKKQTSIKGTLHLLK